MKNFLSLYLIIILSFIHSSWAQIRPIEIDNDKKTFSISESCDVLADPTGKLSIEQLLKENSNFNFTPKHSNVLSLGNTTDAYWIRFSIKNVTKFPLLLQVGDPTIDTIELYYSSEGKVVRKMTGNNFRYTDREIKNNLFLFKLDQKPEEERIYYARVRSDEPLQVMINAGTEHAFLESNQRTDVLQGVYFGFMVMIVLYNLFLFIGVKDSIYLYYVFYAGTICITAAFIKGYQVTFFQNSLEFLNTYPAIVYALASIFSVFFSIKFLNTSKNTPALHKGLMILLPLHLIPIALNLSGYGYESMITLQVTIFISSIYLLATAINVYLNGYKPAKFYIAGWSSFLTGVLITILKDNLILPFNEFTDNVFEIGSALEVLLLSFALADRINRYKAEKRKAEIKALKASRASARVIMEQNRILEERVKERTVELESKNKELNKQKEELKELNGLKDKFFSILSHDIRGPLNSFQGILGLLKSKGMAPEDLDKVLEDLKNAVSTTRNLLDNILHWAISHIKEGTILLSAIDLRDTAQETINLLSFTAKIKKIELSNQLSIDYRVTTDVNMVRLVLRNLISNAIKYTPENGTVYVSCERLDNEITISVKDTGLGISEENRKKLFSMKENYSSKGTANEKGTGIGLILCKEFVEKYGGKIWVESNEGSGSTFRFTIIDQPNKGVEEKSLVTGDNKK